MDQKHHGTRTPRPYSYHPVPTPRHDDNPESTLDGDDDDEEEPNGLGSESGTEADDERRPIVKALPAPLVRPRKGLRTGEPSDDVLLTPSLLDCDNNDSSSSRNGSAYRSVATHYKRRIRLAEFTRRLTEAAVSALLMACACATPGTTAWTRELLVHAAVVGALVLAYPVRLAWRDATASRRGFRVPASFDPATVLYPPFLPVMVALSVSRALPAAVLPNLVLGLAALPQRLFPRVGRGGGVNEMHWLVSVLPVMVAGEGARTTEGGMGFETLVSLYPLHHALLAPLHFLTTTSLLVSERHLLSIGLINILLLASSPQALILRACLWIGGVPISVLCAPFLRWNLSLVRVPTWKLRRPGYRGERKSIIDAVGAVMNVSRVTRAFRHTSTQRVDDSDADDDDDGDVPTFTARLAGMSGLTKALTLEMGRGNGSLNGASASRDWPARNGDVGLGRRRSTTLPLLNGARSLPSMTCPPHPRRRTRGPSRALSWCLRLTPAQAARRKRFYSAAVYASLAAVVLGPVRRAVAQRALDGHEPIGWALAYLFAGLPRFRSLVLSQRLEAWIPLSLAEPALPPVPSLLALVLPPPTTRLLLATHWLAVLALALLALRPLAPRVEIDTRRKVFHGAMVAMLAPSTYLDPRAAALALALALVLFLALECLRAAQLAPLGDAVARFVAPYVDGRDLRGPVVVSHIFLLVGCAVPLWLSLAARATPAGATTAADRWAAAVPCDVDMVAGVVCVGLGDAAASLVGRRVGRRKWVWVGGKSLEGSAAFAGAVVAGLAGGKWWAVRGGWVVVEEASAVLWAMWGLRAAACALVAALLEAVLTGANDNVVVPVALWVLVRGAGV